jgi:hypothetical protein
VRYSDEVTDAVVATVTVCAAVPVICPEEGILHVGAGVATGVIAQLRLTVPVNPPVPAKARLKLAVCPAVKVCLVEEPEAAAIEKSGAAGWVVLSSTPTSVLQRKSISGFPSPFMSATFAYPFGDTLNG